MVVMIKNYSYKYENLAQLANTCTMIKFYSTPVCFIIPIMLLGVAIVLKAVNFFQNKERQESEEQRKGTL